MIPNPQVIYFKELTAYLGLKDHRSAKRWCANNGCPVFRNPGQRSSYVIRSQFEVARNRVFIQHLKERHGADWLKAYQAHVNFNIELLSALQETKMEIRSKRENTTSFIPTSENEKSFLEQLISVNTSHP